MAMFKRCTSCYIEKRIRNFHKNSRSCDGRSSRCSECVSQYKKVYYQKKVQKKNQSFVINTNLVREEDLSIECCIELLKIVEE